MKRSIYHSSYNHYREAEEHNKKSKSKECAASFNLMLWSQQELIDSNINDFCMTMETFWLKYFPK